MYLINGAITKIMVLKHERLYDIEWLNKSRPSKIASIFMLLLQPIILYVLTILDLTEEVSVVGSRYSRHSHNLLCVVPVILLSVGTLLSTHSEY